MKSLEITKNYLHFYWTDQIKDFQLSIHFVTEADKFNMFKGQGYIALQTYLTGRVKHQIKAMKNGIRDAVLTFWLESIQFFLPSYPTPNAIMDVLTAI